MYSLKNKKKIIEFFLFIKPYLLSLSHFDSSTFTIFFYNPVLEILTFIKFKYGKISESTFNDYIKIIFLI